MNLPAIFGLISSQTAGAFVRPHRVALSKKARAGYTKNHNQPRSKVRAQMEKQSRRRQRGRR